MDTERRIAQGEAIAAGYLAVPQTEAEIEFAYRAAVLSIADEPWQISIWGECPAESQPAPRHRP